MLNYRATGKRSVGRPKDRSMDAGTHVICVIPEGEEDYNHSFCKQITENVLKMALQDVLTSTTEVANQTRINSVKQPQTQISPN